MKTQTTHFWDFSLWIYRQPGVEQSFLKLQANNGCDVNLLLFCCWGGFNFGILSEDIFIAAVDYSKHWGSEVVQPLRDTRNWMKGREWITAANDHEKLRDQFKTLELEAERLQQLVLEQLTCNLPSVQTDPEKALDAIIENLDRYLRRAGINTSCSVCDNLATILYAVFPSIILEVIWMKLDVTVQSPSLKKR